MQGYVKIKNGTYRNQPVVNEVFPLIKQYQLGSNGGFVTVDGTGRFGKDKIRITIPTPMDYELVSDSSAVATVTVEQSDEERIKEIAERFDILHQMTLAVINGDIRGMIVSGPPGVGKSYMIETEIDKANLIPRIAKGMAKHTVIKGSASALGLYKVLYEHSDENSVVVFDDCDSILFDDVSLNLLKGVLDSGKSRRINWLTESRVLADEGIPRSFNFKGTVIFITNMKFDQVKPGKLKDHLDALQSRCHYLDLTLDTTRDKILRIKQIAQQGALFSDMGISDVGETEIVDFIVENQNKMREISLRMAIKVAQLYKSFPFTWQAMAKTTCMRVK